MRECWMSETARLVTVEEFERYPEDDHRYELVDGRVVRMSPVGYQHGKTVTRLAFLLGQHLEGRGIGVVVTEVGFALARNPDTVRAPDLAFIRQGRIPSREPKGFWHGPPDLAVEVVSSEDRLAVVHQKVEEYLAPGVRAVVVIDPAARTVAVWPQSRPVQVLGFPEVLDLDDIIPGFRCGVHRIFE